VVADLAWLERPNLLRVLPHQLDCQTVDRSLATILGMPREWTSSLAQRLAIPVTEGDATGLRVTPDESHAAQSGTACEIINGRATTSAIPDTGSTESAKRAVGTMRGKLVEMWAGTLYPVAGTSGTGREIHLSGAATFESGSLTTVRGWGESAGLEAETGNSTVTTDATVGDLGTTGA
jgi:hypothetical protein